MDQKKIGQRKVEERRIEKGRKEKGRTEKGRAEKGRAEERRIEKRSIEKGREEERRIKKGRVEKSSVEKGGIGRKGTELNRTERKSEVWKIDKQNKEKSVCPVAKKCGGCKWINKPYTEQLKQKQKWVKDLLAPFGKTEEIIGMKSPYHYRNKVHAVFGMDRKHNVISGTYKEGTHEIVPIETCMIENSKADAIIASIRELLPSFRIRPYNEDTGYGLLRHVLIRTADKTGQIMVVLVLGSPVMPSKNNFVKALLKLHPEITTIVVNVNNRGTSMILGDKEQVIYGKGYIEDELCGKIFRISPKSFYQVNAAQTRKLYEKALDLADIRKSDTVLDAYCGTGTIGIIASDKAGKVIGVELNADAVRDARNNAKRNGVSNIQFYQNDAGKFMIGMAQEGEHIDVLLMDPPRSGSDEAFLSSVAQMKPAKVVYISCHPETLARDLKYLTQKGYKMQKAVPVDMFPWTSHVETVALLSKLNVDKHISVEVELDELDLTSAESKATYAQIKEYILEKFGLKVSALYIAQIKKKCGIELRENYNKSKKEKQVIPQCTPEKEEAIMDALRHFKMI